MDIEKETLPPGPWRVDDEGFGGLIPIRDRDGNPLAYVEEVSPHRVAVARLLVKAERLEREIEAAALDLETPHPDEQGAWRIALAKRLRAAMEDEG